MARIRWPSAASRRTAAPPTKPEAPVTKMSTAIQYTHGMRMTRRVSIALLGVLLAAAALCQPLPLAKRPEEVGPSSERRERVRRQMQADVEGSRIPGAVLLIARQGKVAS